MGALGSTAWLIQLRGVPSCRFAVEFYGVEVGNMAKPNIPCSGRPENLPVRQQDLSKATALWLAGYSKREACRQTGTPRTTLSRHLEQAGWTEADRAKYTDHVADIAHRVAEEAGRQLLERLEDAETSLSPMQLATVFGICADKLTAVRRLSTPEAGGSSLEKMLRGLQDAGGGAVTLTVEPAQVIEAKAEEG